MVILQCQVFSALTQLIVFCWQVWVIDLDIAYSDRLAMTQMLLLMTGGTLKWQTGCLEVQMPTGKKRCEHQAAVKV